MDFFSQTYNALRGPTGAPQSPLETIQRLAGRLSPSTLLADRRAAVLSLKGLSRDWRSEVGETALPGLLEVLENDAEIDSEIAKAVLETLHLLCDVGDASPSAESKALALKYSDEVLKTDKPTQKLFVLLGDQNFYVKYSALQLLATLLHNRRQLVQSYFLKAQDAPANVLGTLDDRREIIRNEGLILIQSLTSQSPDIQKLLAFEGAFDKLFGLIQKEGGVDGGPTVRDCLTCVDGLLRLNTSNQTFFRETGLVGFLTSQLLFPMNLPPQEPTPQEFALQLWDPQKTANVRLVIGILGLLVSSKGSNEAETNLLLRCLVELALASNAPTVLKTQALQLLPANLTFPLISHMVTPYLPVPDTNGEEWDRLEPIVALDALIDLIVLGEYGGNVEGETRQKAKESLLLRTAGATAFENYTRKEELRLMILQAMLPNEARSDPNALRPTPALLQCLAAPPTSPLSPTSLLSTQLAALLFSSLIRSSSRCKQIARQLKPSVVGTSAGQQFFIPADGSPSTSQQPAPPESGDDEPQTLIALLAEHLSLAFLSRTHAASAETERDAREWDRLVIVYLSLLAQWLWEDPKAVREYLENGGLGMLVEPINQTNNVDPIVQGLCAFLLGVCYEFNRDSGEITRSTIHSIITRLSADALIGRMARVREDERFRAIGPEEIVLPYRFPAMHSAPAEEVEVEIWFDWPFVDFWKSNYYTIQRAVTLDPDTLSSASGENAESAMLVVSLQEVIRNQAAQIEELQTQLNSAQSEKQAEVQQVQNKIASAIVASSAEISDLKSQIESLKSELEDVKRKSSDAEKEQEDLLVLLDELSAKRKRDKETMRRVGLEVSEDEGDGDEEDAEAEDD
ncbi:USO1 [Sanghuangporus sanghuang]